MVSEGEREEYWRGHVAAWRASGLTLTRYAAGHGIGRWALGRWSRRLGAAGGSGEPPSDAGPRDMPVSMPLPASAPLVAEVLVDPPRRRRWSDEQKLAMVAEAARPGATLSLVARRHGISPSLLFRWRQRFSPPDDDGLPLFAPVELAGGMAAPMPAGAMAGLIEIELAGGRRLRVDRHVDADALRRVLGVLEGRR